MKSLRVLQVPNKKFPSDIYEILMLYVLPKFASISDHDMNWVYLKEAISICSTLHSTAKFLIKSVYFNFQRLYSTVNQSQISECILQC